MVGCLMVVTERSDDNTQSLEIIASVMRGGLKVEKNKKDQTQ